MKSANLRTCLYYVSVVILLGGLGSAALIYATSHDDWRNAPGYEQEGGSVYPIQPEDSKQYQRALQLYGGMANVLADELRRWLEGWFHGRSLALTVACISILISLAIIGVANHLPPRLKSDSKNGNMGVHD